MKLFFKTLINTQSMIWISLFIFLACKNNTPSTFVNNPTANAPTEATTTETVETTPSTYVKPTGKTNIKLKINGLNAGSKVQLAGIFADQNFLADEAAVLQDGTVYLKRDSLYQPGMYFVVMPNQQNFQMLLDADQEFEMTLEMADPINTMKVTGSVDNDLLYQSLKLQMSQDPAFQAAQQKAKGKPDNSPEIQALKKLNDELRKSRAKQLDEFEAKYPTSLFVKFKRAGQNPEVRDVKLANGQTDLQLQSYLFRSEYWNGTDFSDPRLMYTPVMANKIKQFFNDLTPQHQDSINKSADFVITKALSNPDLFKYVTNFLLFKYEPGKTTLMDGEAVFSNVVNKYYNAKNCPWFKPGDLRAIQQRATEMSLCLLNQKAQDVVANDPSGTAKSIMGLKSPYIIVYLYHTDCEHCQESTPKLAKMYPQLKSRGVEIFTIAVNTTDAEWKKFIQTYNMQSFTNVFDPTNRSVYGKYFVDNTPEIYVLNKDRKIIGKNLKVEQINSILDMDQGK